jgi:hypothetical protein
MQTRKLPSGSMCSITFIIAVSIRTLSLTTRTSRGSVRPSHGAPTGQAKPPTANQPIPHEDRQAPQLERALVPSPPPGESRPAPAPTRPGSQRCHRGPPEGRPPPARGGAPGPTACIPARPPGRGAGRPDLRRNGWSPRAWRERRSSVRQNAIQGSGCLTPCPTNRRTFRLTSYAVSYAKTGAAQGERNHPHTPADTPRTGLRRRKADFWGNCACGCGEGRLQRVETHVGTPLNVAQSRYGLRSVDGVSAPFLCAQRTDFGTGARPTRPVGVCCAVRGWLLS